MAENKQLEEFNFEEKITLSSFSTMFILNIPKNYQSFAETHKQYELILVNHGQIYTYENGKEYLLKEGQIFLRKPYSEHYDKYAGVSTSVSVCTFLSDSSDLSFIFDQVITLTKDQYYMITSIFTFASKYIKQGNQFVFNTKRMISDNVPYGFTQLIKNKLEAFFISLVAGKIENKEDKKDEQYSNLSLKIIDILDRSIYQKFDLQRISDELNYSKNYLCRHFKMSTGFTISNYFYFLKITEAKKMLLETDKSVNEISDVLNFETVQYFSLCFKKNVGTSPSVWRKNARAERFY